MNYKLIKIERKYNGWMKVDDMHFQQQLPSGDWSKVFTREVIRRSPAVVGLIVDPVKNTLLLTCQLRPGGVLNDTPYVYEMVAGMIDEKEDAIEALKRESLEEAGVKNLKNVKLISSYFPSCGALSEKVYLYYAEANLDNLEEYGGCPEEDEVIKIKVISFEEAFKWQEEGRIHTANGQVALNWLKYNLLLKK